MDQYKISIILPVFKAERYLDYALASLKEQTIGFGNLQVIFYDDCSPDSSGKIIDQYAQNHSNVIALHSTIDSGSAGKPRNQALLHANAPYIMYLDPDDLYMPDACEVLYNTITNTLLDFVGGYYITMNEDGMLKEEKTRKVSTVFQIPLKLNEIRDLRIGFWTKIYRRSFLLEQRIFFAEGILGEDMVFSCRALLRAKSVAYIDKPIVFYRLRAKEDKSVSFAITPKLLNDISDAYAMIAIDFLSEGKQEVLDNILREALDHHMRQVVEAGERDAEAYVSLFEKWQWFFCYIHQRQIKPHYPICQELMPSVVSGNYQKAASLVTSIATDRNLC